MKRIRNPFPAIYNRRIAIGVLLIGLAGASVFSVWPEEKPAAAQPSFDSYRMIWDKNIFNPNRRAMRNAVEAPRPAAPPPEDRISLSGTMIFEEGSFAFFDGSQSDYRRVAKLGDEFAGFRIAAIETEGVILMRENEQLDLPVGKSLIEREKGKWEVGDGMRSDEGRRPDSNRSDNRAETAAETRAAETSDKGGEDVLAKLRQRRSQEMKP
ncbi:MAG: hypothetical protein AB1656_20895 [Candidatus Omnitrophota bacterium]